MKIAMTKKIMGAKARAALKHMAVTSCVAIVSFVLVFEVWYPGAFSKLMPGTKLFFLIMLVEVILGPCMSLVIFNPEKSRRELLIDYLIVISVQITAFSYGIISVVQSRPVYVVFVKDRFEVVSAAEILRQDLAEAEDERFKRESWGGPVFVCARAPKNASERQRLLFEEIPNGKDVQYLPRFYRSCTPNILNSNARPFGLIKEIASNKKKVELFNGKSKNYEGMSWWPIVGKTGTWVAFVTPRSSSPVGYINIDPF